jgi:Protein of unknown function (DUF1566)
MSKSSFRYLAAIVVFATILPSPARATAPAGRYTVSQPGTVYDTKTRLTWQQAAPSATYTWTAAKSYCGNLGATLGGTGWRLPSIRELASIIDYSQATAPTIDTNAFPGTPADAYFWSSSAVAGVASNAWYVHFSNAYTYYSDTSTPYNVRCVR